MISTASAVPAWTAPAGGGADEQMRQIVTEIRATGWVSPRLAGYLNMRDTAALEASAHRQVAALAQVDPLLAQVVAPLNAPVAQLVPDQSADSLRGSLQRMSEATGRAEARLSQVHRQVPERWAAGEAADAMQAQVAGLRAQMSAGSSAAEAADAAVDGATRVVTAARALALANIVQGTSRALAWVQQYGRVLIQRGQLAEVVRQVGAVVQQIMQQIRVVVTELTDSQQSLATIVKRLGAAVAVLGTAGGGAVLLAGGGKKPKVKPGRVFINSPHQGGGSTNVVVPDNYQRSPSRTGDGTVYKHPVNQESVRVMPNPDQHGRYPNGRTIITGGNGDRLGPDGKPGDPAHTHHHHGNKNGLNIPHIPNLNSPHPLLLLPGQEQWLKDRACESKPAPGCPGTVEQ